jgi:hypothetical protein
MGISEDDPKTYWIVVTQWARQLGLDPKAIVSRFQDKTDRANALVASVIVAMGGSCLVCKKPANSLGVWKPDDPTLFDSDKVWAVYTMCNDNHDPEHIESALGAGAKSS